MLFAFYFFLGAFFQVWQAIKLTDHISLLHNRKFQYAMSHAVMLFVIGLMAASGSRHWLLIIILLMTVLPPIFWGFHDLKGNGHGKGKR